MSSVRRDLRPRNGRPPRTDFAKFVDALPGASKLLGLTHITSSYNLRDILEQGSLENFETCEVLEERVVYAFYGRAAFRTPQGNVPASLTSRCPTVLILDPNAVPPPKYAFGFDSGAFMDRMMDPHLDRYMPLFDFLITPDPAAAAKLIGAVFGNNENFLLNRPQGQLVAPIGNFEAESYLSIVRSDGLGERRMDDRYSTPEFVFAHPINIQRCIKAAVMPDDLAHDPNFGGLLRSYDAKVFEYQWVRGSRPDELQMQLRGLVRLAYESLKWL